MCEESVKWVRGRGMRKDILRWMRGRWNEKEHSEVD